MILLARWPRRGVGKSRLAAGVGEAQAYRLQQAFLEDTVGWAEQAHKLLIAFTPPAAAAKFRRVAPSARLRPQPDGDLGARIHQAFVDAFAMGAGRAVIIGSDSPNLPHRIVRACMDGLAVADAVIAPTIDGGFCALGLKQATPGLFAGVPWSTGAVLDRVVDNARQLGLEVRVTEAWYDVDDIDALHRLRADLSLDGKLAVRTRAALMEGILNQNGGNDG